MLQIQSRLSSRYQTVIPSLIREALDLKAGDRILWRLIKLGNKAKVIAEPRPKSWAKYSRGLGKFIWEKINIDQYISEIRDEWKMER